jgi:hypothetical protein
LTGCRVDVQPPRLRFVPGQNHAISSPLGSHFSTKYQKAKFIFS